MKPYYQDKHCTIYHGDCRELALEHVGAVVTDPPYGINYKSGHNTGYSAPREWNKWRRDENFPPIQGDDTFDGARWLGFDEVVMFCAPQFLPLLPASRGIVVWDKREDVAPDNQADCEFIWTSSDRPSRIFRHLWRGLQRKGEENVSISPKLHPHQKPVALMRYLIGELTTGTVLDPYMGSGTTLRAAKDLNRQAVGVELEEKYCEIAAKRLLQEVLNFGEVA